MPPLVAAAVVFQLLHVGYWWLFPAFIAVALVACLVWQIATAPDPDRIAEPSRHPDVSPTLPPPRLASSTEKTTRRSSDSTSRLGSLDWFQFERVVAELFVQEGLKVQRLGGANPDGGIDLMLTRPDGRVAVQCKHWKAWRTGVRQLREFNGAMKDHGISRGIFVCLQQCSREAQELAARNQVEIITGEALLRRLEAVGWQTLPSFKAILDDRRKLCPRCESLMTLRTARRGASAGQSFWGCSTYPRCHFTMPAEAERLVA